MEIKIDKAKFAIILLILATFFWGTTFILVKETVEIIPLDGFLTVRFGLAALVMLIIALSSKEEREALVSRETWIWGSVLGVLIFASFWFQTVGLTGTSPTNAAFITGLNVILIPIFSTFYPFKEKPSKEDFLYAIVGMIGLALLTVNFSNFSVNGSDLIIILTAIAIAYHVLVTDKWAWKIRVYALVTVQLFTVAILSLFSSVITGNVWNPLDDPGSVPLIVWMTILVTALLATAFALSAQQYAQKIGIKASTVALIFILEPVFALVLDLVLGTIPTIFAIGGIMIILVSIYFSIREQAKKGMVYEDEKSIT